MYFCYLKHGRREFPDFRLHSFPKILEVSVSADQQDVPVEPRLSVGVALWDGGHDRLGESTLERRSQLLKLGKM